jgi:hypothetical protein
VGQPARTRTPSYQRDAAQESGSGEQGGLPLLVLWHQGHEAGIRPQQGLLDGQPQEL